MAERYNPEDDDSDSDIDTPVVYEKAEDEVIYLKSILQEIFLFKTLDDKQIESVIAAMSRKDTFAGEMNSAFLRYNAS